MIDNIRRRLDGAREKSARTRDPQPLLAYVCPHCSSDAVTWAQSEPLGATHTQVRARCGACGTPWQSVMPRAIATRFEAHLAAGSVALRRALERLEREPDVERLALALIRG
jgi:hypothetical protein